MTNVRNADPNCLYPPFRVKLEAGLAHCTAAGLGVYLFEGWRPASRQTELYAQGRTTPGKIVTESRAWESWHQYGLAADLAFGGPGRWTWDGPWQNVGAIMQGVGLEWYGAPKATFRELPHFQLTYGLDIAQMAKLAKADGVFAVWERAGAQP